MAELLWTGALPGQARPVSAVPEARFGRRRCRHSHAARHRSDRRPHVGGRRRRGPADEARGDLRPATVQRKARTMLGVFARTPLPARHPAPQRRPRPSAAQLWPRLSPQRPTSARVRALDAALVLLADHEMATSTLAARVAASTRANPFACVLAAIGAVSGPLHGRAAIGTHRILAEALSTGNPAAAVEGALEAGEHIPGMGHSLYEGIDPRADLLLERVGSIAAAPAARTIDTVRRLCIDASGREPNIDFALGALALAGAMPFGATEGVFATGRTAGWVGHVLEEYDERPLRYRPRAIYTGPEPVT